jgi:DNA invertase Pin-like site-specific DNA recombinase
MPNSNFLVFSESFYIERFSNKGYRYHLGQETKQPRLTITRESKQARKERFNELMKKNNLTRTELARHLGVSRAWVTKVLNK